MSGIGTLRVKSFFRSLDFCPDFFSYLGKRLNKRAKVNFKILTSQTGKQPIAIHILPKFSRSKSYQAMRFDQLIEHNKINIYLWKSCRKWGRETRCRALFVFKKSLYEIAGVTIKTKSRSYDKNKQYNCSQRTALILRYAQFWFFWKRPGISFSTKFCVWFLKKKSCYILWTDQISIVWLSLLLEILCNMSSLTYTYQVLHDQESQDKKLKVLRIKKAFKLT